MQKGFSLIELMVVIAIVGLLAAIAVPVYRGYKLRTNMGAFFNLVNFYRREIEKNHAKGVVYNTSSNVLVYPVGGANNPAYLNHAFVGFNGCIEFSLSHNQLGMGTAGSFTTIIYCPIDTNGVVTWQCGYHPSAPGSAEIRALLFPPTCQGPSIINSKGDF